MSASKPGVRPVLTSIPGDVVAVTDYERYARAGLDDNAWAFLTAGAADELTLRDNRAAFDRLRLRGAVLSKLQGGHTRLELFGRTYEHPVFLAPVGYQKLFHTEGEKATAQAAAIMSAPMVVSTLATTRLEELTSFKTPLWFQLYLQAQRSASLGLVRRAEDCGCQALVVTVDAPLAGIRNREQRANFHLPAGIEAVNVTKVPAAPSQSLAPGASVVFDGLLAHAPTWDDLAWLTAATSLPVVVKGILNPADALLAIQHGAKGIVVSNHGGRVLDTLPASIDALPSIAGAVAGRVPLLLDGGIRRGSDIFKAIALGASAVLIGRPYIHALAAAGALGVAHVLRTLREELEICMALSGCATLAAIDDSQLFRDVAHVLTVLDLGCESARWRALRALYSAIRRTNSGEHMSRTSQIVALGALVTVAAPLWAHHGFGRFDATKMVTLEGTVTGIDFVNPHAYLYFDATGADGKVTKMRCEMRAATVLRRSGWSPEMFTPGKHVAIYGNPHRDDSASCYIETMTLGEEKLERYQQLTSGAQNPTSRPARVASGEPNIYGDWAQEQYLIARPPTGRGGLVPKSMVPGIESGQIAIADVPGAGWGASPVTLTPVGQAAADALRARPPDQNERARCEITSVLFDWVFDGPVNRIAKAGDTITFEYGRGLKRTVHMNLTSHPAGVTPSRGGHSIGRWDGDTLVIDTVGFTSGSIAGTVPHSDKLHVVERLTLNPQTMALTRDYVADDPVNFTDQYAGKDIVMPADAPYAEDRCEELTYRNYSQQAPVGAAAPGAAR